MAPDRNALGFPTWVEALTEGTRRKVRDAICNRGYAKGNSATRHKCCRARFKAADSILDQIADGKLYGAIAYQKARSADKIYRDIDNCTHGWKPPKKATP